MRGHLIKTFAIAASTCVTSCGGGLGQGGPDTPKVGDPGDAPPACQAAKDPLNPMIVEWPTMSRSDLDAASRRGIVVVRYAGCVMKVLTNCTAEGSYAPPPPNPAGEKPAPQMDTLVIEDESKLYAELPLGVASLKGELAHGKKLELSYVAVGQRASSKAPAALSGDCRGATHWVKSMTVGAYALDTMAATKVGAGAGAMNVSAGGEDSSKRARKSGSGDVEGCRSGGAKGESCNAILKLGLAELATAGTATAGFGTGLGPVASVPAIPPPQEFAGPAGGLGDVAVAVLQLLQSAKRADTEATLAADKKAAAWEALAAYLGKNPYKASAEERKAAWLRVAEAEAKRWEQTARVCAEYRKDKAKLDLLLRTDKDVVSPQQKEAYKKEFARAYDPRQNDIQACLREAAARAESARRTAERDKLVGAVVSIPAGTFTMGESGRSVTLEAFQIDATEVTLAAYEACVSDRRCGRPEDGGPCNWRTSNKNHPINCVDWNQANAFCLWAGKRLPTEEEWEYAARGTDGRNYPWGNSAPAGQLCWDGEGNDLGKGNRRGTCAVGSYPSGDSPFGLHDMAGNVWEWTGRSFGANSRVARGGSWRSNHPGEVRASILFRRGPSFKDYDGYLGFRCAR